MHKVSFGKNPQKLSQLELLVWLKYAPDRLSAIRPRPYWGSLQCYPNILSAFRGL